MATTGLNLEENMSKLEAQLDLWRAKLKEVAAKANVAGQQAKIDSRKHLDELESKLALARKKLDEAKASGAEKWETLKDGVEHIWQDLEGSFKKLIH